MNDTQDDRLGVVAEQARTFLARAREAAGDLVERVKELGEEVYWVNHLALAPAGTSVSAAYDPVGTGLSGLVVSPRTASPGLGGYLLETVLAVPPGYWLRGVRIGVEASGPACLLSFVRLSQVDDPPAAAVVVLEDDRAHRASGPASIDVEGASIDPRQGPVLLTLGFTFGDPTGWIVVRSLGLRISRSPA